MSHGSPLTNENGSMVDRALEDMRQGREKALAEFKQ